MRPSFEYHNEKSLEQRVFLKLRIRYIIALSAIALLIIVSQVLVQKYLSTQTTDARAINLAGRQRMLSQKISKHALIICTTKNVQVQKQQVVEMNKSVDMWEKSYLGLLNGDSDLFLDVELSDMSRMMFDTINIYFTRMVAASKEMIRKVENGVVDNDQLCNQLDVLLSNEKFFLKGMDAIVFQMDKEASERVSRLKGLEFILLLISLGILFFELVFIFRPIAIYIRRIVANLVISEKEEKVRSEVNLKKKGEEQKLRSTLIFEGQERERRRMARDLHDGIGQLLTGLKFQLEAIDVNKTDQANKILSEGKALTGKIIKEIRRISFNLRPSVLSDYGLPSSIKTIVQELNKYTETDISFSNLTGFQQRLHKKVEAQLYRLVQEAVNNALKHSEAKKIQINLWHKSYFLAISVLDNGIGFEPEAVMQNDMKTRSGHGLSNMQERANFIDAELNIKSTYGKGTEVSIYLPIK